MAKRRIARKSSPAGKRASSRTTTAVAARFLSHPLAREVIAASLVYAAASIIRGQAKSGSLSRRLFDDVSGATGDVTGSLSGMLKDARLAITPALDSLMRHFGGEEEAPPQDEPRKPVRRSSGRSAAAARSRRTAGPEGSRERLQTSSDAVQLP